MIAKIGDTTRNGRYRIVGTEWNHNGTLFVDVAMVGAMLHTEKDVRAMRALARRAIAHPGQTRSAKLRYKAIVDGELVLTFGVSRLPR